MHASRTLAEGIEAAQLGRVGHDLVHVGEICVAQQHRLRRQIHQPPAATTISRNKLENNNNQYNGKNNCLRQEQKNKQMFKGEKKNKLDNVLILKKTIISLG